MSDEPIEILDFRTTKCPLNFVKTRLALEKIPLHAILEVWIAGDSESVLNIPNSLRAEGQAVLKLMVHPKDPTAQILWVERLK